MNGRKWLYSIIVYSLIVWLACLNPMLIVRTMSPHAGVPRLSWGNHPAQERLAEIISEHNASRLQAALLNQAPARYEPTPLAAQLGVEILSRTDLLTASLTTPIAHNGYGTHCRSLFLTTASADLPPPDKPPISV